MHSERYVSSLYRQAVRKLRDNPGCLPNTNRTFPAGDFGKTRSGISSSASILFTANKQDFGFDERTYPVVWLGSENAL